jgi:hypothetical protein
MLVMMGDPTTTIGGWRAPEQQLMTLFSTKKNCQEKVEDLNGRGLAVKTLTQQ